MRSAECASVSEIRKEEMSQLHRSQLLRVIRCATISHFLPRMQQTTRCNFDRPLRAILLALSAPQIGR